MGIEKFKGHILTLAQTKLFLTDGSETTFAQVWSKKNTVFVFLRHFGCPACRQHAIQIWSNRKDFESKNAQLAFVGNGTKEMITDFKSILGSDSALVFSEPSMESYYAIGFKRGFLNVMNPHSIKNVVRAKFAGVPGGDMSGYRWQLGGVVFIKTTGEVPYLYFSEAMGDYPAETEIKDVPWISV